MTTMRQRRTRRPANPAAEPAHPVPPRASRSQAVSAAAERLAGSDGTTQASDWLAERRVEPPTEPEGTPVNSPRKDASRQGRARESRRGSQY